MRPDGGTNEKVDEHDMRVLVIPDVHLKPELFGAADRIMQSGSYRPDLSVCLGDLVDDQGCQNKAELYRDTLDAAHQFAVRYQNTLWCYGNHDLAYYTNTGNMRVSRMSGNAMTIEETRCGLLRLYREIPLKHLAVVHSMDHVLFSHAGISRMFVREHISQSLRGPYASPADDADRMRCTASRRISYDNVTAVVAGINALHPMELWCDDSPIWLRPQRCYSGYAVPMYKPRSYLQVVGHSPVRHITRQGNLLSCDVFTMRQNGETAGTNEFCLLDTKTWEYQTIPCQ